MGGLASATGGACSASDPWARIDRRPRRSGQGVARRPTPGADSTSLALAELAEGKRRRAGRGVARRPTPGADSAGALAKLAEGERQRVGRGVADLFCIVLDL
ncbi:hypothetical protein ACJRO7_023976 [Eucalyptus globulus]|uniref:Uncharacterized protein n=1 Tax=Eucalyptus globulus TaxID=34317 RepID=A0ABD3K3R6_EUCGL